VSGVIFHGPHFSRHAERVGDAFAVRSSLVPGYSHVAIVQNGVVRTVGFLD